MMHIIRQHYFHVELNGSESEGITLQNKLSDLTIQRLLPAIERVLDQFAVAGTHLYIEQLTIDAGIVSLENLETELGRMIEQSLADKMQLLQNTIKDTESKETALFNTKSSSQSTLEAFSYFLNFGILPWWFVIPKGKSLEEVVTALLLSTASLHTNKDKQTIVKTLAENKATERLLKQFSSEFHAVLFQFLFKQQANYFIEIWETLKSICVKVSPKELFKPVYKHFWQIAFAAASGNATFPHTQFSSSLKSILLSSDDIRLEISRLWDVSFKSENISKDHLVTSEKNEKILQNNFMPSEDVPFLKNSEAEALLQEGVYSANVGMLLLHPFLPQLFSALEISDEETVIAPDRAIAMLHYMATGNSNAPEYEVLLGKILCGIAIDLPIDANIELTLVEKEEADALLKAVITHWGSLKGTSIDALRGTFLTRPGKLTSLSDGDWLVQVERQSFDILLDSLPWSISMIKLPWMEQTMRVEWG